MKSSIVEALEAALGCVAKFGRENRVAIMIRKYRDTFFRKNAAFICPPIWSRKGIVADVFKGIRWATPTLLPE